MNATGNMPIRNTGAKVAGHKVYERSNFTPQQNELFQQLFGMLNPSSQTSRLAGGDQSSFEQMEAPAWRDFGSSLGNISSRFSGMGDFGGRRSSGFQNQITSAAGNFAQQLQSNRQNIQRQALNDLFSLSNLLLNQRPTEQFLVPQQKDPSFWQRLFGSIGSGVSAGASMGLGGGLANMFGSLFKPSSNQNNYF